MKTSPEPLATVSPGPPSAQAPYPIYPACAAVASPAASRWPRYLRFLKRLWWIPLLSFAIGLTTTAFRSIFALPNYTSAARVWVSGKLRLPEGSLYSEELQFFFGTQLELLQSGKIRENAARRVQLLNPGLVPCPVSLRINQVPKTAMFLLYATGEEPAYTQSYLNALIDEYLNYRKQVRASSSDDTLTSLSEQVYQQEKDLKAESSKLSHFQRENNLAVLQEQGTAAGIYLSKLRAQLSDFKLELQFLRALDGELTNGASSDNLLGAATHPHQIANVNFSSLNPSADAVTARQQLQLLRLTREELAHVLRPQHPKMQRLDEEIARGEAILTMCRTQTQSQVVPTRHALELKIAAVEEAIRDWEGKLLAANSRLAEAEALKANVQRSQTLYDKLLNVLQTVDVNKNLDQEIVSVMERASAPRPTKPSLPRSLVLGSAAGLLAGLALVWLVARLDDRITSVTELSEHFDEEIVGQVPEVATARARGRLELVQSTDNRHLFAESFRNIRSSLLYMPTRGLRPKMILVTSAVPNEGKSTISANLARTMAFAGGKVLLLDADMRQGRLHEQLGVAREPGLSKLLREPDQLESYLRRGSLANLWLISCGEPVPDVSERFLTPHFERLLKELRVRFDHIIIDTAPVFAADDAPTLAPRMDGVLFVLRGGFTRARLARQAVDLLYQRQSRILGLVLNRANPVSGSCYGYSYGRDGEGGRRSARDQG